MLLVINDIAMENECFDVVHIVFFLQSV